MPVLPKEDEVLAQTIEEQEMEVLKTEKKRVDEGLGDVSNLRGEFEVKKTSHNPQSSLEAVQP